MLLKICGRTDKLKKDGTIIWEKIHSDVPFYDLIDFADNEGCLDFEISEKLYNEFKRWEKLAHYHCNEYELIRYKEWFNVFKLAKDNGVVVFS